MNNYPENFAVATNGRFVKKAIFTELKQSTVSEKKPIASYTKLKQYLQITTDKTVNEELAPFTHYLQCSNNPAADKFKKAAQEYLTKRASELNLGENLELKDVVPLKWDAPFPPVINASFTFIDLFAGVGGFRLAFQEQKGKCVFSSEWDKNAQKTYEANFGEVPFGDIRQIDEKDIPEHDILLGGFPCQPFSLAGVSKKNSLGRKHGFADEAQGTLFYDIARILQEKRPRAFLLENVKNLRSHDKGNTFRVIYEVLVRLGYKVQFKVINAKYYVPQARERIYIVGFNQEYFSEAPEFLFPDAPKSEKKLGSILQKNIDAKYTLTDNLWNYLQAYAEKHRKLGNGFGYGLANLEKASRTLSARYYKDGAEILIPQGKGINPRRLTPEECSLLMGYPKNFKIRGNGVSDLQLYRQFGNSVAVPVVRAIAEKMVEYIKKNGRRTPMKIKLERRIYSQADLFQQAV